MSKQLRRDYTNPRHSRAANSVHAWARYHARNPSTPPAVKNPEKYLHSSRKRNAPQQDLSELPLLPTSSNPPE